MTRVLLALMTVLPAIPGIARLIQALRSRSGSWARSIILWGALTMVAGAVVYAAVAVSGFAGVARTAPEEKAEVLRRRLDLGSPALWTGLTAGAFLCVLGGFTRALFKPTERP
jgi:hypothetical protein